MSSLCNINHLFNHSGQGGGLMLPRIRSRVCSPEPSTMMQMKCNDIICTDNQVPLPKAQGKSLKDNDQNIQQKMSMDTASTLCSQNLGTHLKKHSVLFSINLVFHFLVPFIFGQTRLHISLHLVYPAQGSALL